MRSGLGPNPVLSQPTSRGDDNEAAAGGTCRCDVRGSKPDRDRAGRQEGQDGEVAEDGEEKSREAEDGQEKGREDEKGRRQEGGRQEVTGFATQARQGSLPAFFIYAPPFIPLCRYVSA